MAIESNCVGCGQLLRVADEHRGKQARCPSCGTVYVVGGAPPVNLAQLQAPELLKDSKVPEQIFAKTPTGTIYGPVDRETLDRWMREGRLNDTCEVRLGEAGNWVPLPTFIAGSNRPSPALQETMAVGANNPYQNPYSDSAAPVYVTAAQPQGFYAADRSGVVLTMGILSWVLSCAYIGWVLAIVGIVLAQHDFALMREGRMRPESKTLTQVGYWLCVVHLGLIVFAIIMMLVIFLIALANG